MTDEANTDEPTTDAPAAGEPGADEPATDQPHALERPRIDVSKALGEAGHEVSELGYEDEPDSAPVRHEDDRDTDVDTELGADLAKYTLD